MDPVRHGLPILVLAVHALILYWLRRRSPAANSTFESGRMIFRPIAESRFLVVLFLAIFSAAVIGSSLLLLRPAQWWVPYMFIGFLLTVPFLYPPVLTIEIDGLGSRTWYGHEKKIRWEDVVSLSYHLGKKHFTVRAADGRKIIHSPFNSEQDLFITEVRKHTRLPMKISHPWSTRRTDLPYEEVESEME
jgi:hypothetical protein